MIKKISEVRNNKDYSDVYKYIYNVWFSNDYVKAYAKIEENIGRMAGNSSLKSLELIPFVFYRASNYLLDIYDIDVISYNDIANEIRIATNKEYTEDDIIDAIRNSINETRISTIIYDMGRIEDAIGKFKSFANSRAIGIYTD